MEVTKGRRGQGDSELKVRLGWVGRWPCSGGGRRRAWLREGHGGTRDICMGRENPAHKQSPKSTAHRSRLERGHSFDPFGKVGPALPWILLAPWPSCQSC